jgi:hypothetical protein
MRIFQPRNYLSLDLQNRVFRIHSRGSGEAMPGVPEILVQEQVYEHNDSLLLQAGAFLQTIRSGGRPVVSGEDGRNALCTAADIRRQLQHPPQRSLS